MQETVGAKVKRLREKEGWSKGLLAQKAGVSPPYITRLEHDDFPRPSGKMLAKIAAALRVPLNALIAETTLQHPMLPRTLRDMLREIEITTPILVPETSQLASAGVGTFAEAEMWPYMPEPGERGHRFIAVPVTGDCMEPKIMPGHRVIVDRDASPKPGDIVLALHDDEAMVKMLEKRNGDLYLVALKGRPPLKVNQDTQIIGIVKRVMYRP